MYVIIVSYGCCKSRSGDVAYVASVCFGVSNVSEVCFICVFRMHVASVFI
jgi:hypothetical protein